MIGPILQFHDLQELCKPGANPRLATVERWARTIGLNYTYDAEGGIITTVDAFNAAIGLTRPAANEDKLGADAF